MKGKILLLVSAAVFILTQAAAGEEGISFSGSVPVGVGILKEGAVKAFEEKYKIKFTSVGTPGTGVGIKALIDGKVNLAGSARPLKAEEKKEKLLGYTIGYEAVAIYVSKSNPVKNLKKEQLKGIFTGKIKNWKEVGGSNAPITPIISPGENRAIVSMFEELVMNNAPYGTGYKSIVQPSDKIEAISKDENSICAESLGLQSSLSAEVRGKVKVMSVNSVEPNDKNVRSGAYPITTPLLLVTKGLPNSAVKKFIDFMLSKDGQEIVDKNFIPVRR
jgi:phosphate transport system substrate-binding protein